MFKKVSKDQNPYNSFYLHTHKLIGNTAHSIAKEKNNVIIKLITLQKVKKGILGCSKQQQCLHISLQTQTFTV